MEMAIYSHFQILKSNLGCNIRCIFNLLYTPLDMFVHKYYLKVSNFLNIYHINFMLSILYSYRYKVRSFH